MIRYLLFVAFVWSCSSATEEANYLPRPKGFNRIILPPIAFQPIESGHPYRFEISKYAQVIPDTAQIGNKKRVWKAEPHWIYIYYPRWDAFIQITYKSLGGDRKKMNALINDSYTLAYKHQGKAASIQDYTMTTTDGRKAGLIELKGEVATSLQFFTTDSSKHFLRGAIYVKTATQNDSLAPIIQYLKQDAIHLVQTLRWQD
ncbi:gliding motility lipoprotein GldD [Aquirufa sp.]|jgi:gliding motility-associated lipoprotein GldD|uniref:gliding motility lipoprotein GldD n=1 Tax=Aquirufa sp. TaxID=2676249 RepID=UPI0037BF7073